MLLPDVNVLLAGFRRDHVHHEPARAFLGDARSRAATLALNDVALGSLVRLATNPRVFLRPDTIDDVLDYVDALLEPPAQLIQAGTAHWARFSELCRDLRLRGNLVPDAISPRSRSSSAPSSSRSTAASAATRGCAGAACSTTDARRRADARAARALLRSGARSGS